MKHGIIYTYTDELSEIEEDFDFGFIPQEDGSYSAVPFMADGELLEFPASFEGRPVLRTDAYYEGVENRSEVTKVILPEGIEVIGYQSLAFLYSLKGIKLPDSVKKIESFAFDGCSALQEIDMPKGLKVIFGSAFYGCTALRRVGLNEGLLAIGDTAFQICESLEEVHLPASVQEIGENPFEGCRSLKKITVDENNPSFKSIDGCLYSRDGSILYAYPAAKDGEVLALPNGVKEIASCAFFEAVNLTEVHLPESLEVLCENAFYSCDKLCRVSMPRDMAYLHNKAFSYCESLTVEKY